MDPRDPHYDELTKVTTDPFGIDPDRCLYWQKCEQGEIVNGTCNFDERFDKVSRRCMPAVTNPSCNVDECANQTRVSYFEFSGISRGFNYKVRNKFHVGRRICCKYLIR